MTAGAPLPEQGPDHGPGPEAGAEQAWCETCQKSIPLDELGPEGECPGCGALLLAPRRLPWNFRIILFGTAVYLLWRLGQGLDWLARYIGRHI